MWIDHDNGAINTDAIKSLYFVQTENSFQVIADVGQDINIHGEVVIFSGDCEECQEFIKELTFTIEKEKKQQTKALNSISKTLIQLTRLVKEVDSELRVNISAQDILDVTENYALQNESSE